MGHNTNTINNEFRPVNPHQPPAKQIYTVKQFSNRNPAFPEGSLRALIFNAKPRHSSTGLIPGNGLEEAIVRIGRKLLIDEEKFYAWLERQGV